MSSAEGICAELHCLLLVNFVYPAELCNNFLLNDLEWQKLSHYLSIFNYVLIIMW